MILAIDPGSTESAYVWLTYDGVVKEFAKVKNGVMLETCRLTVRPTDVVIEKIASYGMAVGAEVFETVYWSGRFAEAVLQNKCSAHRITRLEVKLQMCRDSKAKDANIRQALIDRYGGKQCIKKGGPLHGVSKDVWAALAVGRTWLERNKEIA